MMESRPLRIHHFVADPTVRLRAVGGTPSSARGGPGCVLDGLPLASWYGLTALKFFPRRILLCSVVGGAVDCGFS